MQKVNIFTISVLTKGESHLSKPIQPVLVGAGQLIDRPEDLSKALNPLAMMQETANLAAIDAGLFPDQLKNLDTLVVVNTVGPKLFANPPAALARRLGAAHAEQFITGTGGNTPQTLVNTFAADIARGRRSMVLLSGAEALDTQAKAAKAEFNLNWVDEIKWPKPDLLWPERAGSNDVEQAHGMVAPIVTYPLFENALRRHHGNSFQTHQHAIGQLFSPFTQIAQDNPFAWFPTQRSSEEIVTPTPVNRYIGFPYTKYMNAVMQVNQSASVLLTSDVKARQLGIDESRWVYLHGHCDVDEIWHVSERIDFHSSPALESGLASVFEMAQTTAADIKYFDVYSCFPAVLEVTREALGMTPDDDRLLTVTGGLPYFGGAGNNYSMHAIATMMDRLRSAPGERGLVTANGWYLTKHALGIYSAMPPDTPFRRQDPATLKNRVSTMDHPKFDPHAQGAGTIETFTVMFDRNGSPQSGLVIGCLDNGSRFVALTPPDKSLLEQMTLHDPIGHKGQVTSGKPTNLFEFSL
jgi:acetyl-CoA C-acetyltransferase